MHCDYAFVCNYAEDAPDGSFHALGVGRRALRASALPLVIEQLTFVVGLSFNRTEAGTKTAKLSVIDADGADIVPVAEASVPFNVQEPALEGHMNSIASFHNIQFPRYGQYAFNLVLDGLEIARAAITVVEVPPSA